MSKNCTVPTSCKESWAPFPFFMPLKTSGPARSFRGITDCPQQTRRPTPESSPALLRQLSHSSHSQILGTPLRPPRRGFSRPRPLVFRWVSAPWKKLHGCNKAGLLEHNGRQTEPITVTMKAGGRSVHTGRGGGVWGWWQGGWRKRGGRGGVGRAAGGTADGFSSFSFVSDLLPGGGGGRGRDPADKLPQTS